jgi:AAA+ ATPase superfamily predicted ATPase
MMSTNPYEITKAVTDPSKFFGRWDLVKRFVDGLTASQQSSYAVYGGRRAGKTSLMRMVQNRLQQRLTADERPIVVPLFMDMELDPPTSPANFFERLLNRLAKWESDMMGSINDLAVIDPNSPALSFAEAFKEHYRRVEPELGGVKLAILVDESEKLHRPSWSRELESNLRGLLSNVSGVSGNIGLIMTGSTNFYQDMAAKQDGSPLRNILEEEVMLPPCSEGGVRELIEKPSGGVLSSNVVNAVLQLAGGHLFLVQYLMRELWKNGLENATVDSAFEVALDFSAKRRDYESWLTAIGGQGEKVYALLTSQKEPLSRDEISKQTGMDRLSTREALDTLVFHNIIDSKDRKYFCRGEMFRSWYTGSGITLGKKSTELFISYSHRDEDYCDRLKTHLSNLRRQGIVDAWHDRKIVPGEEWASKIDQHINSAKIILLLISADFMASDYCWEIEVARAMERHQAGEATVIPIILRPTDWNGAPFSKLQALPKNAQPITEWDNEDRALLDIVNGIRAAISE